MDACRYLGAPAELVLADTGLSEETIRKTHKKTKFEDVVLIWEQAEKVTGNSTIGLTASKFLPFGAVKVVDYVFATSRSLEESVEKLLRFYPLINSVFSLSLEFKGDLAYLVLRNWTHLEELPPQYVDYVLLCVISRIKHASEGWRPIEIQLTKTNEDSLKAYQEAFGSKVTLGRSVNRIVFERQTLEILQPHADPYLCEILESHAEKLLKEDVYDDQLINRLVVILRDALEEGPNLELCARQFGMSRRTLQRRLKSRGYSYQALLNKIRYETSLDLLRKKNMSIEEIGFRLGYSEKSSFYKAFKSWSGKTPLGFVNKREDN